MLKTSRLISTFLKTAQSSQIWSKFRNEIERLAKEFLAKQRDLPLDAQGNLIESEYKKRIQETIALINYKIEGVSRGSRAEIILKMEPITSGPGANSFYIAKIRPNISRLQQLLAQDYPVQDPRTDVKIFWKNSQISSMDQGDMLAAMRRSVDTSELDE